MSKLPERKPKRMLTVEVDAILLAEIKREAKLRGVSIRSIVEYGLETYLDMINPKSKDVK